MNARQLRVRAAADQAEAAQRELIRSRESSARELAAMRAELAGPGHGRFVRRLLLLAAPVLVLVYVAVLQGFAWLGEFLRWVL